MFKIFFDIGETLVSGKEWKPGAKSCLQKLQQSDMPTGVISNTGSLTRLELAAHLPDDFDFGLFRPALIILSSEFRAQKPHPAIYFHAIEMAAVEPWNCVFCGEDPHETWAAQSVGMRSFRVTRFPDDLDLLERLIGAA
jgi:FMN phosphatase YigB (HAD superfamily)